MYTHKTQRADWLKKYAFDYDRKKAEWLSIDKKNKKQNINVTSDF